MKLRREILCMILLLMAVRVGGQGLPPIMFWNVENYYDSFDDEKSADEEFLPNSEKRWSWGRFVKKRNAIAKTIIAAGDYLGSYPAVIGVAEVENAMVLKQLVTETPLAKLGYNYVHRDAGDRRGIDVALLYREDFFRPLEISQIHVGDSIERLRSMLLVRGELTEMNGVHALSGWGAKLEKRGVSEVIFVVCHWASKWGGEEISAPRRVAAARGLKAVTDSLLIADPERIIVIMGDFNDTPDSPTSHFLTTNNATERGETPLLLNRADSLHKAGRGSIKYQGRWELIDHFIVSAGAPYREMEIFSPDFLCEEDKKFLGIKPFRTYQGPKYLGGVSDHFPILLKSR